MNDANPYESPHEACLPTPAKKRQFTFTVVELLVVIAVVALLVLPPFGGYLEVRRMRLARERRALPLPPPAQPPEKLFQDDGFTGNLPSNQP